MPNALTLMWGNEMILLGALVLAYLVTRLTPRLRLICFPAVVSVVCDVLNPYVAHVLLRRFGIPTFWNLFSLSQYIVLAIGVVAGHVALRRIRRSQTPINGRRLAQLGLIIGYTLLVGGLGYLLVYTLAWSIGAPNG